MTKPNTKNVELGQIPLLVRIGEARRLFGIGRPQLMNLVKAGKVLAIGECNYAGWRHAEADQMSNRHGYARMVSSQNYYNLFRRQVELELLPYCTEANVGFLPYFPLAGGWLTGKYKRGEPPAAGPRLARRGARWRPWGGNSPPKQRKYINPAAIWPAA